MPATARPSVSTTTHPVAVAGAPRPPASLLDHRAPALEDLSMHLGGVGVLAGQHPIAAGDQRDLRAQRAVRGGELRPGDPRADDDQMARQLLQVVELAPVEDPLTVRLAAGKHPGRHPAPAGRRRSRTGAPRLVPPRADAHRPGARAADRGRRSRRPPRAAAARRMSSDCAAGERPDPAVQPRRVDRSPASSCSPSASAPSHAWCGPPLVDTSVLRRDAVGQHAGAADPVTLDDRDLRTQLDGDQRRLVARRSAAENRDSHRSQFSAATRSRARRSVTAATSRLVMVPTWPSTRRTGAISTPIRCASAAPTRRSQSVGWLKGWRLTFGGEDVGLGRGARHRRPGPGCADVFVMLYDVSPFDEEVLDEWEGAGSSRAGIYDKLRVRVSTLDGDVLAWTYVLVAYEGGLPSCHYLGPDRRGRREGRRPRRLCRRDPRPRMQRKRARGLTLLPRLLSCAGRAAPLR